MGKIRTRKILFVVAAMLLCVLVAVLIRLFFSNRIVRMTLTPIEVEVGEAVHYADSTRNAGSWLWEFGNGDVSHERSGQYVFKEPGRYQVRLQVDHSLEKKQIVKVNRRANNYGSDQLVKIEAPATAFQGEIISFKGYGPSREWRWQFGESGIVDSREQNPLYAYSEAGRYEVLLTTEETNIRSGTPLRSFRNMRRTTRRTCLSLSATTSASICRPSWTASRSMSITIISSRNISAEIRTLR